MYFVLYDRHFKTIGETYILESWSRTQRAVDFDEIKIVGEQIPYSANPFFIVVNDRQGRQMFSGLASTPSIDEKNKKTTIVLKDFLTLLNSEIYVPKGMYTDGSLSHYIGQLISFCFNRQISTGLDNDIKYDVTDIFDIKLDSSINFPFATETIKEKAYTLINQAINYYNIYCVSEINLKEKTLTFKFKKSGINKDSIKLSDFGFNYVEKSFGDCNRVNIYKLEEGSITPTRKAEYVLTKNNEVVRYYFDVVDENELVYPAKCKIIIVKDSSELNKARYDAVMELAQNRYQENIDLDAQRYKSIKDLTNIDFSYSIEVNMPDGKYKNLPVGEIETDSKGKHIVRLGHRVQELTQEL